MSGVSAAAWIAGGAVGGAVGSVANQGVGIAMGMQKSIDWKGVALAGVSGAMGGYFQELGNAAQLAGQGSKLGGVAGFLSRGGMMSAAARGVLSNVITHSNVPARLMPALAAPRSHLRPRLRAAIPALRVAIAAAGGEGRPSFGLPLHFIMSTCAGLWSHTAAPLGRQGAAFVVPARALLALARGPRLRLRQGCWGMRMYASRAGGWRRCVAWACLVGARWNRFGDVRQLVGSTPQTDEHPCSWYIHRSLDRRCDRQRSRGEMFRVPVSTFRKRVSECQIVEELVTLAAEAARKIGFDYIGLVSAVGLQRHAPFIVRGDNYPEGWARRFIAIGSMSMIRCCMRAGRVPLPSHGMSWTS